MVVVAVVAVEGRGGGGRAQEKNSDRLEAGPPPLKREEVFKGTAGNCRLLQRKQPLLARVWTGRV